MSDEGLPYRETGFQKEPPKSLGGKDLPPDWPHLPPVAVTDMMYEHFKRGEETMIDKHSYDLSHRVKALRYLAIEHSRDVNHPQFELLRQKFTEFKPQIVLVEGLLRSDFTAESEAQGVAQDEEVGFLRVLIRQHNAASSPGEQPIRAFSGDIPRDVWIDRMKRSGYSVEDIAVYDFAKSLWGEGIRIKRNTSLSDTEKEAALQQAEQSFRENPLRHLRKELRAPFESNWALRNKQEKAASNFTQAVERLTGQGISMDLDYITPDLGHPT